MLWWRYSTWRRWTYHQTWGRSCWSGHTSCEKDGGLQLVHCKTNKGHRATFPDMVSFLEKEVKILSHPLFGDISDARPPNTSLQQATRSNTKESRFATTITATNHTATSEPMAHSITNPSITARESDSVCLYCGGHIYYSCVLNWIWFLKGRKLNS